MTWRTGSAAVATTVLAVLGALSLRGHGAAAQSAAPTPAQIRSALARYAHEPGVDAVVAAALAAPALDPARARQAQDRARWSGLLPQARADVRRGQVLDLGTLSSSASGDRNTWSTGDELAFSGRLTFRLDRLLFASEEAALLREQRHLEERRLEIVTQVVHLYFERRRLQLERDLGAGTDVSTEMRIAETEALLDVFTNGAFSRMMAEARAQPSDAAHDDDGIARARREVQ